MDTQTTQTDSSERWEFPRRPRHAVITGASSGIGLATASALARDGWRITLIARPGPRLAAAAALLQREYGAQSTDIRPIDLSNLAAVKNQSLQICGPRDAIDTLICCAGIMAPPSRCDGADGYERQFTVNHLAHHILAASLLPALQRSLLGRIVSVSSITNNNAAATEPWDPRPYRPYQSYAASKLWQLAWAFCLDNYLATDPFGVRSIAAHPGWASTNLQSTGPAMYGGTTAGRIHALATRIFGQSPASGALPVLAAATWDLPAEPTYLGPNGPLELRGTTTRPARITKKALDDKFQAFVWAKTIELTSVTMPR